MSIKTAIATLIDSAANENALLPNSLGYTAYIKQLSAEEKKDHIIIYILAGRDFFDNEEFSSLVNFDCNVVRVAEIDSSVFYKIQLIYSKHVAQDYVHVGFTDLRYNNDHMACFKPYMDVVNKNEV